MSRVAVPSGERRFSPVCASAAPTRVWQRLSIRCRCLRFPGNADAGRCQHVLLDDPFHDSGHEHVALPVGGQPALPFQLVERGIQLLLREPHRAPNSRDGHSAAQRRRGRQRPLRSLRKAPVSDANGRPDGVWQIAGSRLGERVVRGGPKARLAIQVEPGEDGVQDLDGEEWHAGGVGRDPARQPVERFFGVVREYGSRQVAERRVQERFEFERHARDVPAEPRLQDIERLGRDNGLGGQEQQDRRLGHVARKGGERLERLEVEQVRVVRHDEHRLFIGRRADQFGEGAGQRRRLGAARAPEAVAPLRDVGREGGVDRGRRRGDAGRVEQSAPAQAESTRSTATSGRPPRRGREAWRPPPAPRGP